MACVPPGTVARRGSRGVCPARSSVALLAGCHRFPGEEESKWGTWSSGWTRTSARPRSRSSTTGRRCCSRAGSARTGTATRRCWPRAASSATASGRSRAATGSAVTSPSGWLPMVSRSSMFQRSCPPGPGCSPLARDARPTRLMRTRWRWPGCTAPACGSLPPMMRRLRCGFWLTDRRDELGVARAQAVNRLHRLLLELFPGGAKKFLSAAQAKELLATIRPRDIAGKTRRRLAAELITELTRTDKRIKTADAELKALVAATGSSLLQLHGIGPSSAARLLGDVGDIVRFADKGRFASWNGTAPLEASSGDQLRHRLSRAGNRRIHRVLHIMAIVALRNDTEGRA